MANAYPSRVKLPLDFPEGLDDSIFGEDSCTITVSIIRADKLAAGQRFFNTSSPYLELKIHPPDSVFGDQLQRTSYKPLTMDPEWTPFERFQFTTTNMASREIRVYGYHNPTRPWKEPPCLGYSTIKLSKVSSTPETVTLKLASTNQDHNDGTITVELCRISAKEGMVQREDVVYEYERYSPFLKWGNSYPGHLLPTDKGRFSNDTGTLFKMSIDDVAPEIPAEWEVLSDFYTVGSEWEYAVDIIRKDWYPESRKSALCVRRRQWHRKVVASSPKEPKSEPENSANASPPTSTSDRENEDVSEGEKNTDSLLPKGENEIDVTSQELHHIAQPKQTVSDKDSNTAHPAYGKISDNNSSSLAVSAEDDDVGGPHDTPSACSNCTCTTM